MKTIELLPELTEKFEANHTKADGCWLWTGTRTNTNQTNQRAGLNKNIDGTRYAYVAPRYAYTLYIGPIPEGLEIDHLCQVPLCVNPTHLEAVTPHENKRRESVRQTHCKRGHVRTPENIIQGTNGNLCKPCMKAFARAKKLDISTDEAVIREPELDILFARTVPKPRVSSLRYKVDWLNDPHCRDCGHLLYPSTPKKIPNARIHAGQGRCWKCKNRGNQTQTHPVNLDFLRNRR